MDTAALLQKLRELGQTKRLPKGTVLFRQGEDAARFYCMEEGTVKAFYATHDGKQFTKSFVQRGECIASLASIVDGEPSTFTAVCIEDCVTLEVSRAVLLDVLSQDSQLAQVLNALLLKIAAKKERREYELLCLSAEERYQRFCAAEAGLASKLSQEEIARYLGITPVSLSRIRQRRRAKAALATRRDIDAPPVADF